MPVLVKYKNQAEYSFRLWMNRYPESSSPLDKERFLVFAKTVCAYHATNWKRPGYLEKRILQEKPNFNKNKLDQSIIIFENLIDFYKTDFLPKNPIIEEGLDCKKGYYIERKIKNGKIYEEELPYKSIKNKLYL